MTQRIYTKNDIVQQLQAMGAPQNSVVLMHISLRSVGVVEGGAKALLDTLIHYFTADGGLFCVPAHTWHNMGKEITLDMADPHTCLGAFSDLAVRDGRGLRTENPTHSMVIFGDRARALRFAENERSVASPTAPEGCYGRLLDERGFVLLVGVSHSKNTYLHSVAEMLSLPNRMEQCPKPYGVRLAHGEVVQHSMRLFDCPFTEDVSERFPKYETAFRYHRCITDGFVGNAPAQLCSALKMKEVVERIFASSAGCDPMQDEKPLPPKWYI